VVLGIAADVGSDYGREGETVVVLLCGGSKRTQSADIKEAVRYWLDYQQRRKT
jgi:putative component of toxin-antitoxin plasmid stabilization module